MNKSDEISLEECEQLISIRVAQHRLNELLKVGRFNKIPVHLAFGYEAVALSIANSLKKNDVICLTHRNIAHNLAGGASLESIIKSYDLVGLKDAPQMGSMNLAFENSKVAYTSSILGNNLGVGLGIAMNRKLQEMPGQVVVVTGDGAIEEGIFWESLILARTNNLNLLVVLENNNCSMSSSINQRRFEINLELVCRGLNVTYFSAHGESLIDTKLAINRGRESANNGIMSVVEVHLKAFNQHAGATPGWDTDPLKISLDSGIFMQDLADDPLFHVAEFVGMEKFNKLVSKYVENV